MEDGASFELAFWYTMIAIWTIGAVAMVAGIYQSWRNR